MSSTTDDNTTVAIQRLLSKSGEKSNNKFVFDLIWNTLLVSAAIVILILGKNEHPKEQLRLWIIGYAILCVVHILFVLIEWFVNGKRFSCGSDNVDPLGNDLTSNLTSISNSTSTTTSITTCLETTRKLMYLIWWIIGLVWVLSGRKVDVDNAPKLFWLAVAFLAIDVLSICLCLVFTCMSGICCLGLCCCFPAILALFSQEPPGEEVIDTQPEDEVNAPGEMEIPIDQEIDESKDTTANDDRV